MGKREEKQRRMKVIKSTMPPKPKPRAFYTPVKDQSNFQVL